MGSGQGYAIMKMAEPTDTAEVYKIMGTINFLGTYTCTLSEP